MEETVTIPEATLSVSGPLHPMDSLPEAMKQVLERRPDCVSLWLKQVDFEISNDDEILVYMSRKLLEDRLWDQICLTDCSGNLETISSATSNGYMFKPYPDLLASEKTWIINQHSSSAMIGDRGREAAINGSYELPQQQEQQQHHYSSSSIGIPEGRNIPVVPADTASNQLGRQQIAPEHLLFCKTRRLCLLQGGWRGQAGRRSTSDNVIYKQEFWDSLGHVLGNNLAPHLSHLGLYFDSSTNRLNCGMVNQLAKGIATNTSLQEIHLSHVSFADRKAVQMLADGMKRNQHLKCLGLYYCHFDSRNSDNEMFHEFILSIKDHPSLTKLIVNHTHCRGTSALAELVSGTKHLKYLQLHIHPPIKVPHLAGIRR